MVNSMLEITESEYLIKLNKKNFNLSFIRSLLKIVEVSNPLKEAFEKQVATNGRSYSSEPDYFSSIEEK